jgi:site-specific DNA-cytosine methylase
MPLTPEEIERRRLANRQRQMERERVQETQAAIKQSLPVRTLGKVGDFLFNKARGVATEDIIQPHIETREVARERGLLGGAVHGLREAATGPLGQLAGLRMPASTREALDPSLETEVGQRVSVALDDFRDSQGREPNIAEKYDIMAVIQDEELPWLTERRNIGPVSFSNRMLIEGPAEALQIAGEVALTGGAATAARGVTRAGLGAAARMGGTKAVATKAATRTAYETLMIPVRLDRAMGAVVGATLGTGFKVAALPFKAVGKATGLAYEYGAKPALEPIVSPLMRKYAPPGFTNTRLIQSINKVRDREISAFRDQDAIDRARTAGIQEYQKHYPNATVGDAAKAIYDPAVDNLKPPQKAPDIPNSFGIRNVSTKKDDSSYIFGGKVGTLMEKSVDSVQDILTVMGDWPSSKAAKDIFFNVAKRIPKLKGMVREPTEVIVKPADQKQWSQLIRNMNRRIKEWFDPAENKIEGKVSVTEADMAFRIGLLVKAGVLKPNFGRDKNQIDNIMKIVKDWDGDPENITDSGQLLGDILKGKGAAAQGNFTFVDDLFEKEAIDATFKGHTLVSDFYAQNNPRRVMPSPDAADTVRGKTRLMVDPELLPGFGDVLERLDLYRKPLKRIKIEVAGRETTAWDILDEIKIYKELEDDLAALGVAHTKVGTGVLYSRGRAVVPRNPSGVIKGRALDVSEKSLPDELMIGDSGITVSQVKGIKGRTYRSQAEGMLDGQWYTNPVSGIGTHIEWVGEKIRRHKIGAFINDMAEVNELPYGTAKKLLADSPRWRQVNAEFGRLEKLANNIQRRLKRSGRILGVKNVEGMAESPAMAGGQGKPVRMGTSLTGINTVGAALDEGSFVTIVADEWDQEAIEALNLAWGSNYTARDFTSDEAFQALKASRVQHWHVSPVCKNLSAAKARRGLDANDKAIGAAVVRNIREIKPPTITIENVPDYTKTVLYKDITKALTESGYAWETVMVDAADYGAAQARKRMIIRAVRKDVGRLPSLPPAIGGADWYESLKHLIDAERAAGRVQTIDEAFGKAKDELARIKRMFGREEGDRLRLDPNKPILTMGGSASKGVPSARNAGGPGPTLKATERQVPRIIIPGEKGLKDAKVVRMTPEMMRKYMGLREDFPLPPPGPRGGHPVSKKVLGNGVHGKITENFIQPMVDIHRGAPALDPKAGGLLHARTTAFRELAQLHDEFSQFHYTSPMREDMGGGIDSLISDEVTKVEGQLAIWEKRIASLQARDRANTEYYEKIKAELGRMKVNVDRAKDELLAGKGMLTGVGLEGTYFPDMFREAAQKAVDEFAVKAPRSTNFLVVLNSLLRMAGATGDMSAIGIQGWAALNNEVVLKSKTGRTAIGEMKIDTQGDAWQALKSSWRAWANDDGSVVGEYLYRAKQVAEQTGTLTPEQWARAGLGILQNAPDLYQTSWKEGGRQLPLLKRFDRMFTQYGNVVRHGVADIELQTLMASTGKTAQELLDSGDAAQIAAFANVFTGVGKRKFMGDGMQFLVFAPRFFQARFKTASDALKGLGPGTNKTLQQRIAAKRMSRFVGFATYLTFAINEMAGEETDINPWLRNSATGELYFNPNFMRINVGELDISLFGPWDSILRLMSAGAFLAYNASAALPDPLTGDRKFDVTKAFEDIRSTLSAPVTSIALEVYTGEDGIGQTTRPPGEDMIDSIFSQQMGMTMLSHLTPFAWGDFFFAEPGKESIFGTAVEGVTKLPSDPMGGATDIATAGAQTGLQLVGLKSTYESVNETLDKAYADVLELGPDDPRIREAFGVTGDPRTSRMTEDELTKLWAGLGRKWWDQKEGVLFPRSLSFFGHLSEKTPTWNKVASDIQKNLKDMISAGRFSQIMTAEEMKALEVKIQDRMAHSADDYAQYSIARDALVDEELAELQKHEKAWTLTGGTDVSAFLVKATKIRQNYAERRRDLVGPEGKYKGVSEELFQYSRDTALGNLSAFDADIYDTAQAWYYTILYEDTELDDGTIVPSIVDETTGDVDWDLKEEKLKMWEDQMREQFPSATTQKVLSYRRRIEESQKRDAPPAISILLDMQNDIGESGYYDLREKIADNYIRYFGKGKDKQLRQQFEEWDRASQASQKSLEKKYPWLTYVSNALGNERLKFFAKNPHIEAMLQVVSKRPLTPRTTEAIRVYSILEKSRRGIKRIDNMEQFLADVYNQQSLSAYQ